ncbi:MAG: tautomerase family protein [Methanobacteriaceae archaeon]|nr:tautomerase family protein [Methanobacteriaceae archaeon]MDP2837025.1 tautomerase family protein [Methanobacteriaceae archaeon]MDP3034803.1 tautomerase family protein [Methanobacteriaceae archaeon]MDP3485783.1 tautomerase family protein [Methanobacteriaceae archaeon]MDP3624426.1 tautomerase family protein [Methanobacteriaceae archaeon]
MPLITVEAGKMPDDVRIKLMKKLTEVSSEITGIPEASFWVFVKELGPDSTMIGGKTMTEMLKEREGN